MKVLISFKKQDLYQCYIFRRAHIYFELRKYKDIRKGKKIYINPCQDLKSQEKERV